MTFGRNKCVIKGAAQKYGDFIDRVRKSLYFGSDTLAEDMEVSRPLAEYASELFSEPHKGHSLHRLNRVTAGSVNTATPCSLIMALIYLDRLNATDPSYVRRITPQELFIVSMMISTKFYADYDDVFYLSDWAEEGNMTEDRLKHLEREFLCAIDWNIYISTEQFFNKLTTIERTLARREGLRRGWLTYTELAQMLPSFTLVKFLFNNISVMAVSYTAGVMTIAGAFFLASQIPLLSLQTPRNAAKLTTCGVDVAANDVGGGVNLLNETATLDLHLPSTEQQQQPQNRTSMTTSITVDMSNSTYAALYVEEELLILARQYHEEALLEEIRRRNNEFVAGSAPTSMFNYLELMAQQRASDSHRNWLSLKSEYSDEALIAIVQKILVILAFIYAQRLQLKQLRERFIFSLVRWRGLKMDHAAAAFLMLQIYVVYKACVSEILKTTELNTALFE